MRAGEIERVTEDVRRFGACIGTSRRYRIPYLRALAVLAQFHGEIEQPTQYLQEAARLAEEIGLPGELWSIQAALGEIYLAQGDQEQAHGAFKQAATIVRKLADALGTEEQRAHFFSSPEVGSYNFQWRMVQESVAWFGDFTPNMVISVQQKAKEKDTDLSTLAMTSMVDHPAQETQETGDQAASGTAFISPDERPLVGEHALKQADEV